jgi:hypothetical protein
VNITELSATPDVALIAQLENFELAFSYPLGRANRFRISHLPDYTAFYRSQGEQSVCLLATTPAGEIAGTVSATVRTLKTPTGSKLKVAYIGDLKIAPHLKTPRTFFALVNTLRAWLEPLVDAAYGVVMDGTSVVPSSYSGRLGLPPFLPFAAQHILCFSTDHLPETEAVVVDECTGRALYERLAQESYVFIASNSSLRSSVAPIWYASCDKACGMLEDTRKAKRLFADDGTEILSSHLSCFVAVDGQAGSEVIAAALEKSGELGFRAMFLTLDDDDMRLLKPFLREFTYSNALAIIYATETLCPGRMKINTSEI